MFLSFHIDDNIAMKAYMHLFLHGILDFLIKIVIK